MEIIMSTKVHINKQAIAKLKQTIKESFKITNARLGDEFTAVINDPNEFSDIGLSDRDIVWSGRLRDSQQLFLEENEDKINYLWQWNPVDPETNRAYAGDVFVGFREYSGAWVPGRDWPRRAVERLDPYVYFLNELQSRL